MTRVKYREMSSLSVTPLPSIGEGEGQGIGAGATGEIPARCDCKCSHTGCEKFRVGRGCRQWCFVRWVANEQLSRDGVRAMLRSRVGSSGTLCWVFTRRWKDGRWCHCIMLHLSNVPEGWTRQTWDCFDPQKTDIVEIAEANLDQEECLVDPFRCCEQSLRLEVGQYFAEMLSVESGLSVGHCRTVVEDVQLWVTF